MAVTEDEMDELTNTIIKMVDGLTLDESDTLFEEISRIIKKNMIVIKSNTKR